MLMLCKSIYARLTPRVLHYPTSGNNFPTPMDMISSLVCWVSFLWKAILVVNPYVCFLLAVMISSLSSHIEYLDLKFR